MMMKQGWVFEDQIFLNSLVWASKMFLKGWVLKKKMFLKGSDKPRMGLIFQNFRLRRQFFQNITQKHTSSNNNAPRWVNFWKNVP